MSWPPPIIDSRRVEYRLYAVSHLRVQLRSFALRITSHHYEWVLHHSIVQAQHLDTSFKLIQLAEFFCWIGLPVVWHLIQDCQCRRLFQVQLTINILSTLLILPFDKAVHLGGMLYLRIWVKKLPSFFKVFNLTPIQFGLSPARKVKLILVELPRIVEKLGLWSNLFKVKWTSVQLRRSLQPRYACVDLDYIVLIFVWNFPVAQQ